MSDIGKEQPSLVLRNPNQRQDGINLGGGILMPAMGDAALRLQSLLGSNNLLQAANGSYQSLILGSLGNQGPQIEDAGQHLQEVTVAEYFEQANKSPTITIDFIAIKIISTNSCPISSCVCMKLNKPNATPIKREINPV